MRDMIFDLLRHGLYQASASIALAVLVWVQIGAVARWLHLPPPIRPRSQDAVLQVGAIAAVSVISEIVFVLLTRSDHVAPFLATKAARLLLLIIDFAVIGAFIGAQLQPFLNAVRSAIFAAIEGLVAAPLLSVAIATGNETEGRVLMLLLLAANVTLSQQWPFRSAPSYPAVAPMEPFALSGGDFELSGLTYRLGGDDK